MKTVNIQFNEGDPDSVKQKEEHYRQALAKYDVTVNVVDDRGKILKKLL